MTVLTCVLDDGYRLTYGGLDYLALHTHQKADTIYSVGNQIGVGKESDIFVVANSKGEQLVLKIHRLGRISFRTVKNNRDYLRKRSSASWMYMSRLAAVKEFTFMKALSEAGIPVPRAIAQNRHQIVMGLIDGFPLRQISSVPDPAGLYGELMDLIMRLARIGLIHGDFNEFNIMITEQEVKSTEDKPPPAEPEIRLVPVLIDFPQMVSIDHADSKFYFERDVSCIKRYFERRFHFVSDEPGPFFEEAKAQLCKGAVKRIDVEVEASGFSKKMAKELEAYMKAHGVDGDAPGASTGKEGVSEEEDDDSDDGDEADEDKEEETANDDPAEQSTMQPDYNYQVEE
jgi:RIO kinase 2